MSYLFIAAAESFIVSKEEKCVTNKVILLSLYVNDIIGGLSCTELQLLNLLVPSRCDLTYRHFDLHVLCGLIHMQIHVWTFTSQQSRVD